MTRIYVTVISYALTNFFVFLTSKLVTGLDFPHRPHGSYVIKKIIFYIQILFRHIQLCTIVPHYTLFAFNQFISPLFFISNSTKTFKIKSPLICKITIIHVIVKQVIDLLYLNCFVESKIV